MDNKVIVHEVIETDSTNNLAKKLALDGACHLTLVLAHQQSCGRGRYGREWVSSTGNVFWSMILRPASDWPRLTGMSHVAALAVHATIASFVGNAAKVQIKWPNDVLVNGKKIAGILLEANPVSANVSNTQQSDSWVIVGIGINVKQHPTSVNYPATSLYTEGIVDSDRDQVIEVLTQHFVEKLGCYIEQGAPYLSEQVVPLMAGIGEPINVRTSNNAEDVIEGVFTGLDAVGQLIVTKQNGEQQTVSAGDVFFGLKDS